ncbi:MAG: sensor histidine kinase [Planctomycetota bacterium]|nr:MAG: sensor histidine kinase [Planctomycetota bacterium]
MPPILARPQRLLFYLGAWLPVAGLLTTLLMGIAHFEVRAALSLALPQTLLFAFLGLMAWYPARALPYPQTALWTLLGSHLLAAVVSSSLWVACGRLWAPRFLSSIEEGLHPNPFDNHQTLFFTVGVLLYLLAVTLHYLFLSVEQTSQAKRRALEMQIGARDAELKLLRAQVNPHFLFNSLNAIHALVGNQPEQARAMCLKLGEFLRSSLQAGNSGNTDLQEEISLALAYLEVEKVRFGSRLQVRVDLEEACEKVRVPPLLLQPLVENAVLHGISHCLDGGEIRLRCRRQGEMLHLQVSNPRDPEAPRSRGQGLGLENVRRRLDSFFQGQAELQVKPTPKAFEVALLLPFPTGRTS